MTRRPASREERPADHCERCGRRLATVAVVAGWLVLTVGIATGHAEATATYRYLSVVVVVVIGHHGAPASLLTRIR